MATSEATPTQVEVSADIEPKIHLAAQQNSVPVVRSVIVKNVASEALDGLALQITFDPPFAEPWVRPLSRLAPGRQVELTDVDPRFSAWRLMQQTERQNGRLFVRVMRLAEVVAEQAYDVEMLAAMEWAGAMVLPELLAAFVMPNEPAIGPLLKSAAATLKAQDGRGALLGYQAHDPAHVVHVLRALYLAVQQTDVSYANPPASFEETGQRVRTPAEVLHGLGTCLDLSVVLAAAIEQVGLHPFIVLLDGHAFVGCWLTDFMLADPAIDDVAVISKRIRMQEAIVFDSSSVALGATFEHAVAEANKLLEETDRFRFAVDVTRARRSRIVPLSLVDVGPDGPVTVTTDVPPADADEAEPTDEAPEPSDGPTDAPPGTTDAEAEAPSDDPGTDGEDAAARTPGMARLDLWKSRLLDLSLRNRALNFKGGARSISFPHLDLAAVHERLVDGATLVLEPRGDSFSQDDPRSKELHEARTQEDVLKELAAEDLGQGRVRADQGEDELAKRLVAVYRSARSSLEETGANVLFLTLGVLQWYEAEAGDELRRAPILLLPVVLTRRPGGKQYTLQRGEEELELNVTLLEKLRVDFGLDVSAMEIAATESGVDIAETLRSMARLVEPMRRWDVVDECHLAEFSFAKFLMRRDLESRLDQLLANDVFRHIMEGTGEAYPLARELIAEDALDTARPAQEVLTILDADPTQLQAVLSADDGSSFVLQGPPGTGKSQTITNLIGQLLAHGKSVLFVSEKMAALDVVRRRLDQAGLGPFCIELHSNKARKLQVLKQLEQSLEEFGAEKTDQWSNHAASLAETRATLNEFARLLGTPTKFGGDVRGGLARLIGLRDAPRVQVEVSSPEDVDAPTLTRWAENVEQLGRSFDALTQEARRAWSASSASAWTPALDTEVEKHLSACRASLGQLWQRYGEVAERLDLPKDPPRWSVVERLRELVTLLLDGAPATKALVAAGPQQAPADKFSGWTRVVSDRQLRYREATESFDDRLFQLELRNLLAAVRKWAKSFFLFRFFALWGVRSTLKGALRQGSLPPVERLEKILASAVAVGTQDDKLKEETPEATRLLGPVWKGAETDVEAVSKTVDDAFTYRKKALELSEAVADPSRFDRLVDLYTERREVVGRGSTNESVLQGFLEAHKTAEADLAALDRVAQLERGRALEEDPELDELVGFVERMVTNIRDFRRHCAFRAAEGQLAEVGLDAITRGLVGGEYPTAQMQDVFHRAFLNAWWVAISSRVEALSKFAGRDHDALIDKFRRLDAEALRVARKEIRARLASRVPSADAPGDQIASLRKELQKKRRHKPLRKLFAEMPSILRRLKPCMLMSPLSIAQYLDPGQEPFDVVVFDEASQIPPWEAIGAIARGRQVIVVGDSKQLPPTSFFDRTTFDDEEEPASFDEHDIQETESILNEAVGAGLKQLWLRWHYRSRHESLIAFSNRHYYDGKLRSFPSAAQASPDLGVHLHPVPDGFYDRGRTRTNPAEAEAVVQELFRLMALPAGERPSVGVVTFSKQQQTLIEDLVDARLQADPSLAPAFKEGDDPVFIKNLENVQGDERDVMLFSVCYGPDRNHKMAMNFGPLNREGGERRLNVAITRARKKLVVFSTLRADQIDTRRTRAVGARDLKLFLEYAENGMAALDSSAASGVAEPESAFETAVVKGLQARGWQVDPQVGVSGYRIDLGIADPDQPGAYVLAIEGDGRGYHGSPFARERDRLRQSVLEGLGWRFHRIWSTDWWYEPEEELERADAAIRAAIAAARAPASQEPQTSGEAVCEAPGAEAVEAGADEPAGRGTEAGLVAAAPDLDEGRDASEANDASPPAEESSAGGLDDASPAEESSAEGHDAEVPPGSGEDAEPSAANAAAEDALADDASAEDAAAEDAPAEDALADDASAEDAAAEDAPAEDAASAEDAAAASAEDAAASSDNGASPEPAASARKDEDASDANLNGPPTFEAPVLPDLEAHDPQDPAERDRVQSLLVDLIKQYGPLTVEHTFRMVTQAFGGQALTKRMRETLEEAVDQIEDGRRPVRDHEVLFAPGEEPARWRGFRVPDEDREESRRKAADIPVHEVANAAEHVLHLAKHLSLKELTRETAKMLGLTRMGTRIEESMQEGIDYLHGQGRCVVDGDEVRERE